MNDPEITEKQRLERKRHDQKTRDIAATLDSVRTAEDAFINRDCKTLVTALTNALIHATKAFGDKDIFGDGVVESANEFLQVRVKKGAFARD